MKKVKPKSVIRKKVKYIFVDHPNRPMIPHVNVSGEECINAFTEFKEKNAKLRSDSMLEIKENINRSSLWERIVRWILK